MPAPREVLIYPGSPKTGTSALQRMLRCSVTGLRRAGWNYLNDRQEGDSMAPSVGNGLPLMVELFRASGKDPVEQFKGTILAGPEAGDPFEEFDKVAPPGERSIVTSEALVLLDFAAWEPIFEMLAAEGSKVRVVYCVRDLYPFAWSAWIQNVKANAYADGFSEAWGISRAFRVCKAAASLLEVSKSFPSVLAPEDLVFLHYETERKRLIPALLQAGRIPEEACDLGLGGSSRQPVNRSLNQAEVALMREINPQVSLLHSRWCGVTMTMRQSAKPSSVVFHQGAFESIAEVNSQDLERFNAALPVGTDWRLSVLDRSLTQVEEEDPDAIDSREARRALEFLLSFEPETELRELLESLLPRGGSLRRVRRRIRSATSSSG